LLVVICVRAVLVVGHIMAEGTKRKPYRVEEKLKIINRVKSGVSKASIFRETGIPDGDERSISAPGLKVNEVIEKVSEVMG
jgi:hypothetical protein